MGSFSGTKTGGQFYLRWVASLEKKLEANLTQDGLPQLQDLSPYHYLPLYQSPIGHEYLCKSTWILLRGWPTGHEYFQSSSNNILSHFHPLLAPTCNYKMNFICNLHEFHVFQELGQDKRSKPWQNLWLVTAWTWIKTTWIKLQFFTIA